MSRPELIKLIKDEIKKNPTEPIIANAGAVGLMEFRKVLIKEGGIITKEGGLLTCKNFKRECSNDRIPISK